MIKLLDLRWLNVLIAMLGLTLAATCTSMPQPEEQADGRLEPTVATTAAESTKEIMSTPPISRGEPTPNNHSKEQVALTISKNTYLSGDEIIFTISNNLDKAIYYTYGCSIPLVYKVENNNIIRLTINRLEESPRIVKLEPHETISCNWNQEAWQSPEESGQARYQLFSELLPVPNGQYQFQLDYFFDESEVYSRELAQTTRSQIFNIE